MITVDCRSDETWFRRLLESVAYSGLGIVEGVLEPHTVDEIRQAMYRAQEQIQAEVGQDRLVAAGEIGVLRLMLKYDDLFFGLLEVPEVLAVIDATVSETAILHVQNGLVLPPVAGDAPDVFQTRYHRDFPRVLNGYLMSINTFFALDDFSAQIGRNDVRTRDTAGGGTTVRCIPRLQRDQCDMPSRAR